MKLDYKQRLFAYCALLFASFMLVMLLTEQAKEKELKTEALHDKMDAYAEIIHRYITLHPDSLSSLNQMIALLPSNIRFSLIDNQGKVLYDNSISNISTLGSHIDRPEVVQALNKDKKYYIRTSVSNNIEYIYFAKHYNNYFIRLALPYNVHSKDLLQADNFFLYFNIFFFLLILVIINLVAERFSKSIKQLRDFVTASSRPEHTVQTVNFPDDELGQIGLQLADNYNQIKLSKQRIALERQKLLQHIHSSEEGICFFSANNDVEFYNGLFVQYLNMLVDNDKVAPQHIISEKDLPHLYQFLQLRTDRYGANNYFEEQLCKHGRYFSIRANIFADGSYEIILNDITRQEKTRQLKQEMTGNIAHELRTPVTSVRAYLETVLEQKLPEDKKTYFINKAYQQTINLSELIGDMSLLTKLDENSTAFALEKVTLTNLLKDVQQMHKQELKLKHISMSWSITDDVVINGNQNLLFSIFSNLTENSIRYGGEKISIHISIYNQDESFYYLSFYDTGIGITDDKHLSRLFDRFYRVNEGRSREQGGTGLGLAIVKNAVAFHKGTIIAKRRSGGGLEFIFKLKR